MSLRYHGVSSALLTLIAQGHRPRAYYLPQRLMVAYTTLGNGQHPCKHVVCTEVTRDLWLQLTQSLGWPERAPSTNPCALRALDSPHRGGLTVTSPNALSQSPSRTAIPLGFCVPTMGTTLGALRTPQQPLALASTSKNQVKGKEVSLELLTSPPPTWDSLLSSRIKPYTS